MLSWWAMRVLGAVAHVGVLSIRLRPFGFLPHDHACLPLKDTCPNGSINASIASSSTVVLKVED